MKDSIADILVVGLGREKYICTFVLKDWKNNVYLFKWRILSTLLRDMDDYSIWTENFHRFYFRVRFMSMKNKIMSGMIFTFLRWGILNICSVWWWWENSCLFSYGESHNMFFVWESVDSSQMLSVCLPTKRFV